jgi:hypothetical protein
MSTRGWYEYHVLDPVSGRRSLAMQFYKWGDATPDNALDEYLLIKHQIEKAEGLLPVIWLDDLLRDQLGELYERLPSHFSIAAFLFLIQRAQEERSPFRNWDYRDLPRDERPDYRFGFAIGEAMAVHGFQPRTHPDPLLNDVLAFIAAGHFVRPWCEYALTWSVLQWLQYLTQPTQETRMGSIARDLRVPTLDISYLYRFFIWIEPAQPFRITRLAIELCERFGKGLFVDLGDRPDKHPDQARYDREEADRLLNDIRNKGIDIYSLDRANAEFEPETDTFWGIFRDERPSLSCTRISDASISTSSERGD